MKSVLKTMMAVSLASLPFLNVGCVQQDRYDQLNLTNNTLKQQIKSIEAERDSARGNVDAMRQSLVAARENAERLQIKINALARETEGLEGEIDKVYTRFDNTQSGGIPIRVLIALENLAASYSDIMTFNKNQGMIRFASDLTFDLGSVTLKPSAAATLASVADILNTNEASGLEVQVVGHTDNVPIGRPQTIVKHPTNMHLSVHRAISVRSALMSAGIDPARIQAAGYGETRPIVTNSKKGAAENRRVELFLRPIVQAGAWNQRPLAIDKPETDFTPGDFDDSGPDK